MLKTYLFISLHAASVLGILVDPTEDNYDSLAYEQVYAEASELTLVELVSPDVIGALSLKQEELPSFSEDDLGQILDFLDRHKENKLVNIQPKTPEEQIELLDLLFTEENLQTAKSQEELDLLKEEVQQHLLTSDNSSNLQNTELLSSPAGQLFSCWLYAALVGDADAYARYDDSFYNHYYETQTPQITTEVLTHKLGKEDAYVRPDDSFYNHYYEAQTPQITTEVLTHKLGKVETQREEKVNLKKQTLSSPASSSPSLLYQAPPFKQEEEKQKSFTGNEGLSSERIIGKTEFFGPNKVKITWVNGIANDFEDSAASAQMLSDIFHGAQVHFFYNPTEGILKDLIKARSHYYGGECPEAKDLAEHLRLTLKTTDRIVHIGHSHGGIITARAAEYLTPEERARIDVILIGSPALIPEGVFRSATHYVSDQDPIPTWNPEIYYIVNGLKSNKQVVVLPGETIFYNYGFDHYIESATHVKALKDYANTYLASEKPPESQENWWQRIWWWMFG